LTFGMGSVFFETAFKSNSSNLWGGIFRTQTSFSPRLPQKFSPKRQMHRLRLKRPRTNNKNKERICPFDSPFNKSLPNWSNEFSEQKSCDNSKNKNANGKPCCLNKVHKTRFSSYVERTEGHDRCLGVLRVSSKNPNSAKITLRLVGFKWPKLDKI